MASANDAKIKTLLQTIEQKKAQMGTKPRAVWKTNGVIEEKNINTINGLDDCITLTAKLINRKEAHEKACEFLGVSAADFRGYSRLATDDALDDLKLRVKMIQWDSEKKKLTALENQLKNLRSEDLKTEDALADIVKDLG